MSYLDNDLGYDLGYDSEPVNSRTISASSQAGGYPSEVVYRMDGVGGTSPQPYISPARIITNSMPPERDSSRPGTEPPQGQDPSALRRVEQSQGGELSPPSSDLPTTTVGQARSEVTFSPVEANYIPQMEDLDFNPETIALFREQYRNASEEQLRQLDETFTRPDGMSDSDFRGRILDQLRRDLTTDVAARIERSAPGAYTRSEVQTMARDAVQQGFPNRTRIYQSADQAEGRRAGRQSRPGRMTRQQRHDHNERQADRESQERNSRTGADAQIQVGRESSQAQADLAVLSDRFTRRQQSEQHRYTMRQNAQQHRDRMQEQAQQHRFQISQIGLQQALTQLGQTIERLGQQALEPGKRLLEGLAQMTASRPLSPQDAFAMVNRQPTPPSQ